MNAQVIFRRLLLARDALVGRMDETVDLAQLTKRQQAIIDNLRRVAEGISREREYWFKLWFEMGREFENTQNTLLTEIDSLRRKLGMPEGKWEEIQRKFHERYVEPPSHPVAGVTVERVDPITGDKQAIAEISSPPKAPDLSGEGA